MGQQVIDDLHENRTCVKQDSVIMNFTRFPKPGVMLKSRSFEIVMPTVKEIVGDNSLEWVEWKKNSDTGKYEQTG